MSKNLLNSFPLEDKLEFTLSMDNKVRKNLGENRNTMQVDVKQEDSGTFISKKSIKRSIFTNEVFDKKDLLIAQLQEQVAKQRECISYYESIVQLMNYRLMKLKKVLKAHQLLEELD